MDLFQSNDALQQAVDNRMDTYQPPVEEVAQEDETIAEKADNLNKVETEREINLKKQREKYEAEIRALKDENNQLRQKNKHIPDEELVEGNTWKDTYWGYDTNLQHGENRLGFYIMEIRKIIRGRS